MKLKLLLVEDDETLLREMTAYFSGCYDVYGGRFTRRRAGISGG